MAGLALSFRVGSDLALHLGRELERILGQARLGAPESHRVVARARRRVRLRDVRIDGGFLRGSRTLRHAGAEAGSREPLGRGRAAARDDEKRDRDGDERTDEMTDSAIGLHLAHEERIRSARIRATSVRERSSWE